MKRVNQAFLVTLCLSAIAARAQSQITPPDQTATNSPDYTISARGAHHRVWSRVTWSTNLLGKAVARTNSYTELATSMHHLVGGSWVDSDDQMQLTATGAQATNSQHQVGLAGNLNSVGAIDLTTPDGAHLTSTILGISFFDSASGNSTMIADLKDSTGQLLPTGNQALYQDAFTDITADVLYENRNCGFDQSIIFRSQLPSPTLWAMDPNTTWVQVLTEFFNPPAPQITPLPGPGSDSLLTFGSMQMGRGEAFALGAETNRVRVIKQWLLLNGRTVLVEQVPFKSIQQQLQQLPPSASILKPSARQVAKHRILPQRKLARNSIAMTRLASLPLKRDGVLLDYTILTTQTNLTLACDTTYYVSGSVNLRGVTTIEGGTVVKFTNSSSATITASNVVWKTGPYQPAVFTAKDDNAVGSTVSGSTGNPNTNYYANIALDLSTMSSPTVSGARFSYLSNALAGTGITIQDAQFVQCYVGVYGVCPVNPTLYNVLIYKANQFLFQPGPGDGYCGDTLVAVNVTAHYCTNFFYDLTGTLYLTNSLFACVTNCSAYLGATNSCVFLNSDSGIFQTVGEGAHYLAANSPYRNAGTSSIKTNILADLQQKTTYPPLVMATTGTLYVTTNLSLFPQAQRDTDAVDLGYHYSPIDWAFAYTYLSNATVTVSPGTVITAFHGTWPGGFAVNPGGQLLCQGKPNNPVRFTQFAAVQEPANTSWDGGLYGFILASFTSGNPPAVVNCRFTDFLSLAQDSYHVADGGGSGLPVNLQDCQLRGGLVDQEWSTINFTNCLVERVSCTLYPGDNYLPEIRNNLFYGGTFDFLPQVVTNAVVKDNLFDHTAIPEDLSGWGYDGGHNASVTNCDAMKPAMTGDLVLTNPPNYQVGPLGNYYQPTNSALIDKGSATANLLDLYHYTTLTNQIKETNSVVDIGYHSVAVDANGRPIDTDGDGTPDYLEDTNGNGAVDSGETDWQSATDLGLKVLITRPRNGSRLP